MFFVLYIVCFFNVLIREKGCIGGCGLSIFYRYMPMHDVTPKVVAIAVSTVMITCNTLLQISFFSMILDL